VNHEKGLFITFEGPDGSGKSTQISRLKRRLESLHISTVLTREPGGTLIGEKIREIILDVDHTEMDPLTEALLYAAARSQHVSQVIQPALDRGEAVICDRFMDSSIAYQGFGRGLGDQVRVINEYAVRGLVPDLTFLLLLDPALGKKRIHRDYDRLEKEEDEFHQKVYQGYMQLAAAFPERVVAIDGAKSILEIEKRNQPAFRSFAGGVE
jgi:thymidylate kinase (EC 2.7.4.9)